MDNGSQNESLEILKNRFGKVANCFMIESKMNCGFAKGNNLGIKFLRTRGISNIWLVNSDTVFTDPGIMRDALNACVKEVGLINVKSCLSDAGKNHSIAFKEKWLTLRMVKSFLLAYWERIIRKKKVHSKREGIPLVKIKELNDQIEKGKYKIHQGNYIVTGSVFLLTESFFENYGGIFPETFLYYEEYATILFLKKAGLKTAMVDTGMVLHKHRASTIGMDTSDYGLESIRKIMKLFIMNKQQINSRYFGEKS